MHRTMKREHCVSWESGDRVKMDAELTRNTHHSYLPVMITRLIISLRKAAHLQGSVWSMGESTANCSTGRETQGMQFGSNYGVRNRRDDDTLLLPISPPECSGRNQQEGGLP